MPLLLDPSAGLITQSQRTGSRPRSVPCPLRHLRTGEPTKPYLSLRVELKDLGVCVVIDPNRLLGPSA